MVNPYKCARCKEFFDWDLDLREAGNAHRLPVSCTAWPCSYTVCCMCFNGWMSVGEEGVVQCPDCDAIDGFDTTKPNISPFACLLIAEFKRKPAGRPAAEGRLVATQVNPAAVTPPRKEKKRKQPELDSQDEESSTKTSRQNTPRKKRRPAKAHKSLEVTEAELRELERYSILTSSPGKLDLRQFLIERYVSKRNTPMSESNLKSIMRQAEKLCSGQGITYQHWPDGIVFMKDVKVNLSMDFEEMLQSAKEFEDLHGEDKGHGWLVRHPIARLGDFQRYVIEEELRGSSSDEE